jgi:hypothetical protein
VKSEKGEEKGKGKSGLSKGGKLFSNIQINAYKYFRKRLKFLYLRPEINNNHNYLYEKEVNTDITAVVDTSRVFVCRGGRLGYS